MTFAPIQNRLGVQPVGTTVTCVNKSGTSVAIGDLIITSFIHAGAVVDPQQAANTGYVFNCIRKAVSTETGNTGYLGVVTGLMAGAGANGREVEVQFGGICSVKVLVTATVTPGTLLGVSSTAGVLTNSASVLSPGGYSVTLMDNAAVADGTALKRVYIPVEYKFDTGVNKNGLYGSTSASTFIKDCVAGTDSVDVLTIGDSNIGYNNCGVSTGFREALAFHGAAQYATCLTQLAENIASNGSNVAGGMVTNMTQFLWRGNNLKASSVGNSTFSSLNAKVATSDSNAIALSTAVGTFTNFKTNSFEFDAAFVNVGSPTNTFTSGGDGVRIVPAATTPFAAGDGSGSVPLQYRVVYGTFASGSGQFKLSVARNVNTIVARSATPILTNTGTNGIASTAATLNFNAPEVSTVAVPFACNVDGFFSGTTADYIVGPAAFFWHSLMFQTRKGYSVTNLSYYSGRTTAQLATDMASNTTLINATLRELRERQIVAGGSGRVIVLTNSGINDSATGATYTTSLDSLISVFTTAWATLGYPATDLAFLITSTHPTPNSIGGESWFVNRPIFNANAQAWARANVNDGRNITYCDFEAYRTASQLNSSFNYSFYITESGVLTPYSVHLRTYALGAGTTFSETQVSTVPNPLPGGSTGMALPAIGSENGYFVLGNYMVEQLLK